MHLADCNDDDALIAGYPQPLDAEIIEVLPVQLGLPNILPPRLTEVAHPSVL